MKKLLSLLSVLTISGTSVPTTIAASPYQKEEAIKNIGINYQQTNNLENLNRVKREDWSNLNVFTKFTKIIQNLQKDKNYLNTDNFKKDRNTLYIGIACSTAWMIVTRNVGLGMREGSNCMKNMQ